MQGIPPKTIDILCKGWRKGTHKQYTSYIKKWCVFCEQYNVTETECSIDFF